MRAILVLLVCGCAGHLFGQALLSPPFGRKWGEEPSGLLQWADSNSLDVKVEMPGKQRGLQIFTFQQEGGGLPGHPARAIEARYYRGQLYELTVSYDFPGKTAEEVRRDFASMKSRLEKKFGKFKLNGRDRVVEDGFVTREESFHFEPAPRVFLLMAYTDVEDSLRKRLEAQYSLVYHNGNVGPPVEGVLPGKR